MITNLKNYYSLPCGEWKEAFEKEYIERLKEISSIKDTWKRYDERYKLSIEVLGIEVLGDENLI